MGRKFFSMSVESNTHLTITGNITFSSNCPACAAIATDASLPIILKQIMLRHSDKEGLTFPGIIEDPAWTAGINISARPAIGPEAINLVSFASFIDSIAMFLRVDENVATSNLL